MSMTGVVSKLVVHIPCIVVHLAPQEDKIAAVGLLSTTVCRLRRCLRPLSDVWPHSRHAACSWGPCISEKL